MHGHSSYGLESMGVRRAEGGQRSNSWRPHFLVSAVGGTARVSVYPSLEGNRPLPPHTVEGKSKE